MRDVKYITQSLVVLGACLAISCGGNSGFGLSYSDNNPKKMKEALAKIETISEGPLNRSGDPLVFLVSRGAKKQLLAYDLNAKKELWRIDSNVTSRVIIGRDFVVYKEDESLVGRDILSGALLWTSEISGTFVGAAADQYRVYLTVQSNSRTWTLSALDGKSGLELWNTTSNGALGTPAARGGVVFSPFLKQWLAILDGREGTQLTRIRSIDEEISFVRATPSKVYFGSKKGVFILDEKAASGRRLESHYGSVTLPADFARVHYHWDGFDPIQANYSAYDRNRILWQANATTKDGQFAFLSNMVTVQVYRFFFGFSTTDGELKWAFNHPRVDVIASAQLGATIGIVSMLGELGALDAITGKRTYSAKIDGQFSGATFDAFGWVPSEESEDLGGTAVALASIAKDRDARFNKIKRFAVKALSELKGGEVSRDLLVLIQNKGTPSYLIETASSALIERQDPAGLTYLVDGLDTKYDFVEGTSPKGVTTIAQAISKMDLSKVDRTLRERALRGLVAHLENPATPTDELIYIVQAIGKLGDLGESIEALHAFLLIYRVDPAFSTQLDLMSEVVRVLLNSEDLQARELVAFVAEDLSTQESIAEIARKAVLGKSKSTKEGLEGNESSKTRP